MKILQIMNSLGTGGAEKLLLDTIPLYRQKGIEMDVLVLWDNDLPFMKALRALNCCKIIVLKDSGDFKDIYSLTHILKLRKYLTQYDIAHVHLFPAQYFTVFANLLTGNKCKLIFTEHNTTNKRIQKNYFRSFEKYIYSKYSKLICISDEIEEIYKRYLPSLEFKTVVIQNGINIGLIRDAHAIEKRKLHPDIKDTDTILLQVSAFRAQKDQNTVIRAVALLPVNIILLLVGDGETINESKKIVEDLSLEKRVFFLGQRTDIPQLLKTAKIIILSSKYEGLSLSSIEGMAAEKPFVASDVPGLRDVVSGAGILFQFGNSQELTTKIMELLENESYYNSVADSCIKRASNYDIKIMVDKHIGLYEHICEK